MSTFAEEVKQVIDKVDLWTGGATVEIYSEWNSWLKETRELRIKARPFVSLHDRRGQVKKEPVHQADLYQAGWWPVGSDTLGFILRGGTNLPFTDTEVRTAYTWTRISPTVAHSYIRLGRSAETSILRRAFWDVGIRTMTAEIPVDFLAQVEIRERGMGNTVTWESRPNNRYLISIPLTKKPSERRHDYR